MTPSLVIAGLALGIWLYLILFRGGFWLARERDQDEAASQPRSDWPNLAVVIPARDEAEMLPLSVGSLLAQDYAGKLSIVIVDDGSSDGTAKVANAISADATRHVRLIRRRRRDGPARCGPCSRGLLTPKRRITRPTTCS